MLSRPVVSAGLILYVNDLQYAMVSSFEWNSDTPRAAELALDSVTPFELAPTSARVTGSLSLYRLSGDGGAEGAGLTTQTDNLSREKYFSLTLIEIRTGAIMFSASECSVTGQHWSAPARGVMTGTLAFEALSWSNEVRAPS